jgi:hypothetical protein
MQFKGEMLDKRESKKVMDFLNAEFGDILDNLDYHTDAYGNIILSSQRKIEKLLRVI